MFATWCLSSRCNFDNLWQDAEADWAALQQKLKVGAKSIKEEVKGDWSKMSDIWSEQKKQLGFEESSKESSEKSSEGKGG